MRAEIEVTLMIRPPPRAFMPGMQYLASRNGPVRLIPMTWFHRASGIDSTGVGSMLSPALLTRMPMGLSKCATVASIAARTSWLSETSACTRKISQPALLEPGCQRLGAGAALVIAAGHIGAQRRESFDDRGADPRGAAGDKDELSVKHV